MPTKDECKRILSKLGFKLGVSPREISDKLLSNEDKKAMLSGDIDVDTLESHIKVWIQSGKEDMVKPSYNYPKNIQG